jgi:DNA polymerase-4
VEASLIALVDRVARRLRAARRVCRTVTLRLRFADFTRATRARTLAEATAHTQRILATARELLAEAAALIRRRGITLIGVAVSNLSDDATVQLVLPFRRSRAAALDAAVDEIRERYGLSALTRATLVGRSPGISVPLLPD